MNSNNSDTHSWRDPTDTTHGDCWIHVDIVSSSSRHWPRHTRRRTSCYTYKHCIRRGLATHQQIVMRLWALADYYELSSWIILNRFFEKLNQEWMSCFLFKHWESVLTHRLHLLTPVWSCWLVPMLIPWVLLTGWSGPAVASILQWPPAPVTTRQPTHRDITS